MRSVSRRRIADYVRPALGEARVARMWAVVSEAERVRSGGSSTPTARPLRLVANRGRAWGAAVLVAGAVAAALVLGFARSRPPSPALTGLLIDTGAATQEVSLTEGSTLHLAAATRLRVLSATAGEFRLRLEHGSVVCDVVHRDDRRFLVEAGDVEVEDRGTRFAVDVTPGAGPDGGGSESPGSVGQGIVAVRVERGAVEVHDASRTVLATLKPGQTWTTASPTAPLSPPLSPPLEAPSPEAPRPEAPSQDDVRERPPTPAPAGSGAPRAGASSPQALFRRADAERLAGRHADAAADFERFHRRYPNDPRAGLAAYELGRIRLGSLHDPRGAAEAFGAVLEHPDDPFREDAEAGRVEALADLGDAEGCRRARDAFRARYPSSPHAGRVAKLCGR